MIPAVMPSMEASMVAFQKGMSTKNPTKAPSGSESPASME